MILSDGDIIHRLNHDDRFVIDPLFDQDIQIQPSSIDFRLGNEFIEIEKTDQPVVANDESTYDNSASDYYVADTELYTIMPDDFVLGTTKERFEVPPDLLGEVNGRSSLGRLGMEIHATAGIIDPGYEGEITLEISNASPRPISISPGMRIGQIVYTELKNEAERPYGQGRGSKYQGQKGPEQSRVYDDEDL